MTEPERTPANSGEPASMKPRVGLAQVGWTFLQIGAVAFGGLGAALALLQRELVDRRGWLTARDISDALAFTKPLPGSTVVQVVAFVGWRVRGWPGTGIAALGFLAPSATLMIAAAALLAALPESRWLTDALAGLQVAVVGLLASAMWQLARSEARGVFLSLMLLAAFAIGLVLNAAAVVVLAGIVGALVRPEPHRG